VAQEETPRAWRDARHVARPENRDTVNSERIVEKGAVALITLFALSLFAPSPQTARAAETEIIDQPNLEQTLFVIPNGQEHLSDCPTANREQPWDGKACSYRLKVNSWDKGAQELTNVFSANGSNEDAQVEMPWKNCALHGRKLFWEVEIYVPGSGQWETPPGGGSEVWVEGSPIWSKSENGSFEIYIPGCDYIPPHLRHFNLSNRAARRAIVKRLYPMFVSRLVCRRRGIGFRCKTTFNNTYTQCRAIFRVDRYGWVGGSERNSYYISITRHQKHCRPF
jgi:hypothetical protein